MAAGTTGAQLMLGSLVLIAFAALGWVWGERVVLPMLPDRGQRFAHVWNIVICGGLTVICVVAFLVGAVAAISGTIFR